MKRCVWLAMVVFVSVMAAGVYGADKQEGIGGVLNVESKGGVVSEARVTTQLSEVYYVVLDANGKKLAGEGNGKTVVVTGSVKEKDGKKWVTVSKYEVLKGVQF